MPTFNGVRAVLFDLDGTLRYSSPSPHQAFFDQAVALGLPDSLDGRAAALRWAHGYWADSLELSVDRESYPDDESGFWSNYARRYLQAFGCNRQQADSFAPDVFNFMREGYVPEDRIPADVPDTLARLKRDGYTMGVVSNRDEGIASYLAEVGLDGYFSFSLAAGEAESWKPDPGIFFQALRMARTRPEESIYVGDNYYADVVGARRAGLTPVLVDPEDTFPDADCAVIRAVSEIVELL